MNTLKEIEEQQNQRTTAIEHLKAIEAGAPIKERVKEVVDEETFIEGLQKIITRDYFPDVWKIQEYRKWKEENQGGVGISELLSKQSVNAEEIRDIFEKDVEKMNISQYIAKYTSEDNNSLSKMMQRDKEKYLEKNKWMFQPYLNAIEKNQQLQIESDNKLNNMIEGSSSGALQFIASDPISRFIFNSHTPAIESYSDPLSYSKKQIDRENTRFAPGTIPKQPPKLAARPDYSYLGKRDFYDMSTPVLLGMHREKQPGEPEPFNLKKLLGEKENSDEEPDGELDPDSQGFKLLKFPSPSPSWLGFTRSTG